jgi:hypothetical protein
MENGDAQRKHKKTAILKDDVPPTPSPLKNYFPV